MTPYNSIVDAPLARDTDADIEQRQIDAWRQMSPAQKLRLVTQMSAAVRSLALAGVRQRYPAAPPREQFLRLAIQTLGADLATRAYPDAAGLVQPPVEG